MRFAFLILSAFGISPIADTPPQQAPQAKSDVALSPISLNGFRSGISHWRNLRDPSRFIQVEPGQPSYRPEQVREIAANILLFQRSNGGWPKDFDMTAVLTPGQRAKVVATREHSDTSYDNDNIHSQVDYLARAYVQAREPEWRSACERGLDFMLASQYPNGGFPQRFPRPTDFHAYITFNDGVMMGILNVLQDAAEGKPQFAWLDAGRRDRVKKAVDQGVECILKCQIRVEGHLTGWCQQHDQISYEAKPARTFELASICPQDTTQIVRFLLRYPSSRPDVTTAIESAVNWLSETRLSGIKVEKVKANPEEFIRHTADFDVVVQADPKAAPIWARHYEIGTNKPVFAGRDGIKRYSLAEIERERRTGTVWYGNWPLRLLDREYPAWKKAQSVPK